MPDSLFSKEFFQQKYTKIAALALIAIGMAAVLGVIFPAPLAQAQKPIILTLEAANPDHSWFLGGEGVKVNLLKGRYWVEYISGCFKTSDGYRPSEKPPRIGYGVGFSIWGAADVLQGGYSTKGVSYGVVLSPTDPYQSSEACEARTKEFQENYMKNKKAFYITFILDKDGEVSFVHGLRNEIIKWPSGINRHIEASGIVTFAIHPVEAVPTPPPPAPPPPPPPPPPKGDIRITSGVFQPAQVVWQSDPGFPPEDLEWKSSNNWVAHLPMIAGKKTLLFGASKPDKIELKVSNSFPEEVEVKAEFRILDPQKESLSSPSAGRRIYLSRFPWRLPAARSDNKGGFIPSSTNIELDAPVGEIIDVPFTLDAGSSVIRLQLLSAADVAIEDDDPQNQHVDVRVEVRDAQPAINIFFQPLRVTTLNIPKAGWDFIYDLGWNAGRFIQGTFPIGDPPKVSGVSTEVHALERRVEGFTPKKFLGVRILEEWNELDSEKNKEFLLLTAKKAYLDFANLGRAIHRLVLITEPGMDLLGEGGHEGLGGIQGFVFKSLPYVAFVKMQAFEPEATVAHEIGHSYGLWIGKSKEGLKLPEQYERESGSLGVGSGKIYHVTGRNYDNNLGLGRNARGYWIDPPYGKPHWMDESVRNQKIYSFMGATHPIGVIPYPEHPFPIDQRWIDKDDYRFLLQSLDTVPDPEVLLISGLIFKDGSVELDEWYWIEKAEPDLLPGGEGEYSIRLLDAEGKILESFNFGADFTIRVETIDMKLPFVPFAFKIPYEPGTAKIQILGPERKVLGERFVSLNPPSVRVLSPNGGEKLTQNNLKATWEASDLDGDPLIYTVLYSADGGENWLPLASGLRQPSLQLETPLEGSNFKLRVIATDGVNTAKDDSDGPFTLISNSKRLPQLNFTALITVAAVAVAIAVVTVIIIRRRMKKSKS